MKRRDVLLHPIPALRAAGVHAGLNFSYILWIELETNASLEQRWLCGACPDGGVLESNRHPRSNICASRERIRPLRDLRGLGGFRQRRASPSTLFSK